MKISLQDLKHAAKREVISGAQAENLWTFLSESKEATPKFQLASMLNYLGALIIIAAMTFFFTLAWATEGAVVNLVLSLSYTVAFSAAGSYFWARKDHQLTGGLLTTVAVCMTPLTLYSLQKLMGWWPQGDPGEYHGYYVWVKGSWFFLEMGTIVASLIALRFISFPFLVAPAAFSLWYMSMDLTPLLFGKVDFTWEERSLVSAIFGLIIVFGTYFVDLWQQKKDFAFWGYVFGAIAFWGGLTTMHSDSELNKFFYCMVNLLMIFVAVFLRRPVFAIFGTVGIFGYLSYVSYQLFKDALLFPIALSALGLVFILLGVLYQKNQVRIQALMLKLFPAGLRALRPPER
ncbi:MAG: DUF2157 domain-containing protein [bacterium]|nr:DUF2157 domain-containing protein [bacterium]